MFPFLFSSPNIYLLSLSSLFILVFFFPLNLASTLYTFSQRRSAKIKMEIEASGQVVLTLSNPTFKGMKTLRLKQQIMPFEINFILWLRLSWEDQVLLPYLSRLNFCKSNPVFSIARSNKISETWWHGERNSMWSWFHLIGACRKTLFCWLWVYLAHTIFLFM